MPTTQPPEGDDERREPQASGEPGTATQHVVFERLPLPERQWTLDALRDETVGGVLLLASALIALIWVNSAWGDVYLDLAGTVVGPEALHLNLSLSTWAADGLLAIFFFIAGVELRHELQLGTLRDPKKAAVPIAAALGGMVVPAVLYIGVQLMSDGEHLKGWGIPMATDIAFALAVLAVVGRRLPVALRAFLLSLAVVDDLGAIIVIAVFYSEHFDLTSFVIAVACLVAYGILQRMHVGPWYLYVLLAVVAWGFMHASGVHATVAGVAAGMLTRVKRDPGEAEAPGERAEHLIRPLSAGFAVPVFAFFAAGVDLRGADIVSTITSPVSVGVVVGLVIGKPLGILGTAYLTFRFTNAKLSESISWRDVSAVGLLAGIGFTVSLLIAELAFPGDEPGTTSAKLGILIASLLAAGLATFVLLSRNRHYQALYEQEEADVNADGIPDVYEGWDPATGPVDASSLHLPPPSPDEPPDPDQKPRQRPSR